MSFPTPENSPTLPDPLILPVALDSATPDETPWWGRIEWLWLGMAPLCALLFALALPLAPNDLWYHVRAGEFVARGVLPSQNLMSRGLPLDAPYFYQSWLAEWTLFQTLRWGGLSGLMLLRAFCVSGAVACAVMAAWRRVMRLPQPPSTLVAARWSALAGVLGFALASNNVDLRPQTFSVFFFGLWLLAVGEFRASIARSRTFWAVFLVVLTAIWANTHGAFVVSPLGLLVLALGDALSRDERAKSSAWLALWCIGAVLLNPYGWGLLGYIARLSNDQVSQRFIQEWKSPGFDDWHSLLFWLLAVVAVAGSLLMRRKPRFGGEDCAAALFFIMAARDQRAIIWFALWMVPMLAVLGSRRAATSTASAPVPRGAQRLNAVLLTLLALCPLLLFPGLKAQWPWPPEFRRRFAPTPAALFPGDPPLLLENTTPVAAAEFLRQHPPRGPIFTDMVCGSYLTYATYPQVKPWCDPRIEMFPATFWENYLRLSAGPSGAALQLERAGFSDALLDRTNQPGLVQRLKDSPHWQIVAGNGSTILFRRR